MGAGKDSGKRKKAYSYKTKIFREILSRLFAQDVTIDSLVIDEADAAKRHRRLLSLVWTQSIAITVMTALMIFSAPLIRPYYVYKTVSQEGERGDLNPLFAPNLTNSAVLSWAATSITEIMTIGFGDFDEQLMKQRNRFTRDGWISFLIAIVEQKIRDAFKEKQLVLTTVPTDAPVIIAQGNDKKNGYKWIVEMPVVMTYVTNNNVTRKDKAIIRLTIVRVPGKESIQGMGIDKWIVG